MNLYFFWLDKVWITLPKLFFLTNSVSTSVLPRLRAVPTALWAVTSSSFLNWRFGLLGNRFVRLSCNDEQDNVLDVCGYIIRNKILMAYTYAMQANAFCAPNSCRLTALSYVVVAVYGWMPPGMPLFGEPRMNELQMRLTYRRHNAHVLMVRWRLYFSCL